jgi:hypothetical protein
VREGCLDTAALGQLVESDAGQDPRHEFFEGFGDEVADDQDDQEDDEFRDEGCYIGEGVGYACPEIDGCFSHGILL